MKEIWRNIPGIRNIYFVSNLGRVKAVQCQGHRTNEMILSQDVSSGYCRVSLSVSEKKNHRKHFSVHRLVALAFIPNPDNLPCVNHKDENKQNNAVSNLEWCTHKYNSNYGTGIDRAKKHTRQYIDKHRCKKVWQYSLDGKFIKAWSSLTAASQGTGTDVSSISKACRSLNGSAGSYIWAFAKDDEAPADIQPIAYEGYARKDGTVVNIPYRANSVVQYSREGLLVCEYSSSREASKFFPGSKTADNGIRSACNKSKKTAFGYYWFYKKDVADESGNVPLKISVQEWEPRVKRPVGQFDKNGALLRVFESCAEAGRYMGVSPCNISAACSENCGPKTLHGFTWKHVSSDGFS